MKPHITVLVGLPGVGKSTYYKDLYATRFVYSTDMYIEGMAETFGSTYDQCFSQHIKDAQAFMDASLNICLAKRDYILWDQTNLTKKKRRRIINIGKANGYEVHVSDFKIPETDTELEEWRRRLASRPGKVIPEHILDNMLKSYVRPELSEGFDSIKRINTFK